MNGLCIALIVLLALVLVGQIRIGAQVEYGEDGLFVRVRAASVLIPVFPVKKKERKKATPKKETKKGGGLKPVLELIPTVLDTLKRFCSKLRVDRLELELTVGEADPADAAVHYGQANALLSALWQPMTQTFHVKDGHARVAVDFNAQTPTIFLFVSLSVTLAQGLNLAVVFGWRALKVLIANKTGRSTRVRQGEAV